MTAPPAARLRVLRVTTTIEPEMGGPSHTMIAAAIAEQRAGIDVTVVSTVGHAPAAREAIGPAHAALHAAGVTPRAFRRPAYSKDWGQRWGFSLRYLTWLLLGTRRFDVVHVDYVWSLSTVAAVFGARLSGRPVVLTPHESLTDFDLTGSRSWRRRVQKRLVRRLLLSHLAVIVVASTIEQVDSDLTPDEAVVIPHPVDRPERAPSPATGSATGKPVVGFLGRLHPKKRVPLLLAALVNVDPAVSLVVGGGHPTDELERLRGVVARGPLAGRVAFPGFVAPSEREAFFDGVDLLAMPSDYECFGMVAAEAMAAGRPVVVSERCGVAELVREYGAGIVVPVDDVAALSTAITALTSDPAAAARAAQAAERCVAERLTFEAYAAAMLAVYERASARS